jgi:hypothetical protein
MAAIEFYELIGRMRWQNDWNLHDDGFKDYDYIVQRIKGITD